jgi:hypothetical protein
MVCSFLFDSSSMGAVVLGYDIWMFCLFTPTGVDGEATGRYHEANSNRDRHGRRRVRIQDVSQRVGGWCEPTRIGCRMAF